ncbi:hypothetical protein QR680_010958 [Steinernema hermaphroditum]|uniref:Uncharacterized protein n=1 Tax=Steinernema hermaphroditum TaxID=289476 RepID=A0AA39MCN7_9BILA|nr:hypothetical protein QR680_010958 [Steinernema hermaphroditum]
MEELGEVLQQVYELEGMEELGEVLQQVHELEEVEEPEEVLQQVYDLEEVEELVGVLQQVYELEAVEEPEEVEVEPVQLELELVEMENVAEPQAHGKSLERQIDESSLAMHLFFPVFSTSILSSTRCPFSADSSELLGLQSQPSSEAFRVGESVLKYSVTEQYKATSLTRRFRLSKLFVTRFFTRLFTRAALLSPEVRPVFSMV